MDKKRIENKKTQKTKLSKSEKRRLWKQHLEKAKEAGIICADKTARGKKRISRKVFFKLAREKGWAYRKVSSHKLEFVDQPYYCTCKNRITI